MSTPFSALSTVQPPSAQAHTLTSLLPLELELARVRMRYWNNDPVGVCRCVCRSAEELQTQDIEVYREAGGEDRCRGDGLAEGQCRRVEREYSP